MNSQTGENRLRIKNGFQRPQHDARKQTQGHKSPVFPMIFILFAGFLFCGCAHFENQQPLNGAPATDKKAEARNNAASLLYQLVGEEKNVSKILIIKSNSEELGRLIKAISKMAADSEKRLESLASNNLDLNLHAIELPQGEKATRDAVAKTEEHELLFSSGKKFEFDLLLTQAQALNYGWHLAKIAAENSSRPEEIQEFTAISHAMQKLYDQVIGQMRQNKLSQTGSLNCSGIVFQLL